MSETLVLLSALWALLLSNDSVSGPLVSERLFYLSMVEKRFFWYCIMLVLQWEREGRGCDIRKRFVVFASGLRVFVVAAAVLIYLCYTPTAYSPVFIQEPCKFLAILARQWLSMQERRSEHFTHRCGTAASLSPSRNSAKGIISPAHITDEQPTENTFSAGLPWKKFLANGINHLYCCVRCEGFLRTARHSKGWKDKPALHSQLLRAWIGFPVFIQLITIWDGMQSFASGLYFIDPKPN